VHWLTHLRTPLSSEHSLPRTSPSKSTSRVLSTGTITLFAERLARPVSKTASTSAMRSHLVSESFGSGYIGRELAYAHSPLTRGICYDMRFNQCRTTTTGGRYTHRALITTPKADNDPREQRTPVGLDIEQRWHLGEYPFTIAPGDNLIPKAPELSHSIPFNKALAYTHCGNEASSFSNPGIDH
jgi:hypothetical protein